MAQEILYNRHYEKYKLLLHIVKNAVCYYSKYSKQPLLHLCICGLQILGHMG
jgi:hypothetical protein